jgi:hypothetical protein
VPAILSELRQYGRCPNAILETWVPPEPTLAETVAKESAWAAASVDCLRRWITE